MEAINSMFKWYQRAAVCYAHMADLKSPVSFGSCQWFRRGWTLQELIAPKNLIFYDSTWTSIGSKESLMGDLVGITNIDRDVLSHRAPLSSVCVARRLSWAAHRETTRVEDLAYCLLGIFEINMPMLYGEGPRAFARLQEEIIKSTYDLSIFAWTAPLDEGREYLGFLAESPHNFSSCSQLYGITDSWVEEGEMSVTNQGVRLKGPEYILQFEGHATFPNEMRYQYVLSLSCTSPDYGDGDVLVVPMRKIGPNTFVRAPSVINSGEFGLESTPFESNQMLNFNLLTKMPYISPRRLLGPRQQTRDMVSASRFAIVQIKLPPSVPQHYIRATPRKGWDSQDCVFFSSRSSLQNWGAFHFRRTALFVCFWRDEGYKWAFDGTLLVADASSEVYKELFLLAQGLDYQSESAQDLLEKSGYLHSKNIQVKNRGNALRVSFNVRRDDSGAVCRGPRWIVTFKESAE